MDLSQIDIDELRKELDRREGVSWPRYVTIDVDPLADDNMSYSRLYDDIAKQLGFDIYNEDYAREKINDINLASEVSITWEVNRDNSCKIIAVNGMKISDEPFRR